MTEQQASLGASQMLRVDQLVNNQIERSKEFIKLIPPQLKPQRVSPNVKSVYYISGFIMDRRDELVKKLEVWNCRKPGASIGPGYAYLNTKLGVSTNNIECPNAEWVIKRSLWIDYFREWSPHEEVDKILNVIKRVLK